MKKLMTLATALALLSATAVPPAHAEFGTNRDRGYDRTGGWSRDDQRGGSSWSNRIRELQNFFGGRDVRDRGSTRGNGTRADPTRGGAFD